MDVPCGISYAAYEVGQILGMELIPPEEDEDDELLEYLKEFCGEG